MNYKINYQLRVSLDQLGHLERLQLKFSELCNAIGLVAQKNNCWSRIPLHHLAYHEMRKQFPEIGSQIICNAIYAVCRAYKVLGACGSVNKLLGGLKVAPKFIFLPNTPVYLDKHTLSINSKEISIYSLDGRIRLASNLDVEKYNLLKRSTFREIILAKTKYGYKLTFYIVDQSTKPCSEADSTESLRKYLKILSANENMKEVA